MEAMGTFLLSAALLLAADRQTTVIGRSVQLVNLRLCRSVSNKGSDELAADGGGVVDES